MMPASRATPNIIKERRKAVDRGRTLTHWANKAAPLGHGQEEKASREAKLICRMKDLPGRKIILEFADLTAEQTSLVLGTGK